MKILILLLLSTLSPTLLDRSDRINNCGAVASRKAISKETVNNGYAEGLVFTDSQSAVGLIDNKTARYPECNEFGERFFSAEWIMSASLSSSRGLVVIQNGQTIFVQGKAFADESATVRILHRGSTLQVYLNGDLAFTSYQPGVASMDLRASEHTTLGTLKHR